MYCSVNIHSFDYRLQPPCCVANLPLRMRMSCWVLSGVSSMQRKGEPCRRYLLSQMHLGSRAYVLLLHELARSAGATQRPEPAAQGSPLLTGSDEL